MENNPDIGGEIFQIVLEDKWVDGVYWKSFHKKSQLKILTEIQPEYVLKKIKGHKRVILMGYKFDAELL